MEYTFLSDLNSCPITIDWWSGGGGAIVGVILGSVLTYIPVFCTERKKRNALKGNLKAEIKKCAAMAQVYLTDNITSPSYRLPTIAWMNAYPELLRSGHVDEPTANILINFYIEVDSFNRGLNLMDEWRGNNGTGTLQNAEYVRCQLKAQNILNRLDSSLVSFNSI